MPDLALRTTFIVGYPGETEAEFDELLRLGDAQRFAHVGAFTFSARCGTPAAEASDEVPEAVKADRYGRLMELAQEISLASNRALVGGEIDVLVESEAPAQSAGDGPVVVGRTYRDAPEVDGLVMLRGSYPAGAMVRARIDGALPYDLLCTPVEAAAAASETMVRPGGTRAR